MSAGVPLLEVRDLTVSFPAPREAPWPRRAEPTGGGRLPVVRDLSYDVGEGEAVALVGESGAGKSTSQLALLGLLPQSARVERGTVRLRGRDLLTLSPRALRAVRGAEVGVVFQDPLASLNPYYRLRHQLVEAAPRGVGRRQATALARDALERVGLSDSARVLRAYPHELSGGMRQRAQLAMALLGRPALLIADEPTTALDVTSQARVLDLLRDLRRPSPTPSPQPASQPASQTGPQRLALTLITHDLAVAATVADRILVLYAGRLVEEAPAPALFAAPAHPYTRALLAAIPRLDGPRRRRLPVSSTAVKGPGGAIQAATSSTSEPACAFAPRCPLAQAVCHAQDPPLRSVRPHGGATATGGPREPKLAHRVRCHFPPGDVDVDVPAPRGEASSPPEGS